MTDQPLQPELTEQESWYEHIQGGAIDAFDKIGYDVVECRLIRQLFDRKAGYHKNIILLVGMPFDVEDFVDLLRQNPLMSCIRELKVPTSGAVVHAMEPLDVETLSPITTKHDPSLPQTTAEEQEKPQPKSESELSGLMWCRSFDNGWAGKSSWGKEDIDRAIKELDSHNLLASKKAAQRLIDEVEHSQVTHSPVTTVVLCWQQKHDQYLKMFCDALPYVTVYSLCDGDPSGEERSFAQRFGGSGCSAWDTKSDVELEKDLEWVIQFIAHVGESTWLAALPKVGKTWVLLCIVKALLTGEPLFGDSRLTVPRKSKRVIYLCPEAGRGSMRKRLKMLELIDHLYDPITNPGGRLYLRTLSKGQKLPLTDSLLLELTKGADIFIDTAIRYLEGDENSSKDVKVLTENVLNLLSVGARSLWVAHHAPKGFENASTMTLQNMFRGSGEYGAALTNAYGLCTEDEHITKIRLHCITGRDLDEQIPDMILVGSPYLHNIGNFFVETTSAEPFRGKTAGKKADPDKQAKIDFAKTIDGTHQQIADAVNAKFDSKHDRSTFTKWLKESEFDKSP